MSLAPIPSDYKPEDSFTTYKDGKYTVEGIEWFSIDKKSSKPILVNQQGKLVGRFNFKIEGEESGPPYSIALGDMSLLLRAFNVKNANLPAVPNLNQPDKISAYMEAIEKAVNASGNTTKVKVNNGWAQEVEGLDVPEMFGYYEVVDVGPKNSDGLPESKTGQYGPFFFVTFKVLSGEGGNPSPYDGASFTELVGYAVKVIESDGVPAPTWETGEKGGFTANAQRLSKLMSYTTPHLFEGEPMFSNPYNLLVDWFAAIQEVGCKPIKGSRVKGGKSGRVGLDLLTIQPAGDNITFSNSSSKETTKAPLDYIKQLMDLLAGSPAFVQGTLQLTSPGRNVAKTWLSPLKKAGKIENQNFDLLTEEEISTIFDTVLHSEDLDEDDLEAAKELFAEFQGEEVAPF